MNNLELLYQIKKLLQSAIKLIDMCIEAEYPPPPPPVERPWELALKKYGVLYEPFTGVADLTWKVVDIQHLSPEENGGRHNVFVRLLDEHGENITDTNKYRLLWGWENQRSDEQSPVRLFDKRGPHQGEVDLFKNQKTWIQVFPGGCDKVTNLHSGHPDEGPGNTWHHHSFLVVFQRSQK